MVLTLFQLYLFFFGFGAGGSDEPRQSLCRHSKLRILQIPDLMPKKSPALRPAFTLFNPFSAVPLFFVKSKLVEQGAGEFTALPTVLMPLGLAACFYRADVAPKWLHNMYTAVASHLFLVSALTAQDPTSRFNHSTNLHFLLRITYQTSHLSVMFPVAISSSGRIRRLRNGAMLSSLQPGTGDRLVFPLSVLADSPQLG